MSPQVETRSAADMVFADLIHPLSEERFFAEYWEKKPFVSTGRPEDFFIPLFSIRDMDRFIHYTRPRSGFLDLVTSEGFVTDNYLNSDGTANVNLVREGYLKGSTVILGGLEQNWEPLVFFAGTLEARLSHPVAMAVYLTPPNNKGVKPHYDTQENFLVQVEGVKSWKIYKPVYELPPVEGSYQPVPREKLSEPILETVLHPGDVLYIPRGFVHEGAAGEKASLHVTVDIHVRTWLDFFSDALHAMADRDPRFRRALPAGFMSSTDALESIAGEFDESLEVFRQNARLNDAIGKHAEALAVRKPPPPDGHFAVLHADILPTTGLKVRRTSLRRLFKENGVAGMQFSGNQIIGPEKIAPALEFIAARDRFTPASLPDSLNENEKLVLVRRLVRIGLLTLDQ
jgi:hypothetical protein